MIFLLISTPKILYTLILWTQNILVTTVVFSQNIIMCPNLLNPEECVLSHSILKVQYIKCGFFHFTCEESVLC